MKALQYIFVSLLVVMVSSCSDAEIVSGTFHGKMYGADTLVADVKITSVSDGFVRLDLTSSSFSGGYVEYAQLTKNGELAYQFQLKNASTDSLELTGYYFEGFLSYDSWTHHYKFMGDKEE